MILDFAAEDEGGNWGADYYSTGLISSLVAPRTDIAGKRSFTLREPMVWQAGNLRADRHGIYEHAHNRC